MLGIASKHTTPVFYEVSARFQRSGLPTLAPSAAGIPKSGIDPIFAAARITSFVAVNRALAVGYKADS